MTARNSKQRVRTRAERLEARVTAEQKNLFQRAAKLQGRTLTDFVVASVHEAAVRTIADMRTIRLSAEESRTFADALLNPREPGERLRASAVAISKPSAVGGRSCTAPYDEALGGHHDRAGFSSGVEALDRYFRTQAGQDARRRIASCFVLVRPPDLHPAGYYTISATSIALADLPPDIAKRLPQYPTVPATLMGRLAIDVRYRGQKLGELLLFDAFARALRSEIASFAFIVDAKDEAARRSIHYRFLPPSDGNQCLPIAKILDCSLIATVVALPSSPHRQR
jgi:uncharacterized protein (DUF1778 family)